MSERVRRADFLLVMGAGLCGTYLLGLPGLIVLGIGFALLSRARRAGETDRPWAVTFFAVCTIADASGNLLAWSIDTFSHNTHVAQVFMNGLGRLFDGAYYHYYNTGVLGGTSLPGEKSWQLFAVLAVFPLRIAAAWAFLKLRSWGYRFMVITSWAYVFFTIGYISNAVLDFPHRMGVTFGGILGWWLLDIWYFVAALATLPWLYTLDARRWNKP